MAAEQRVFFRDVKPYEVPDDLDTLQGPTGGEVVLSHSVLWAPEAAGSISTVRDSAPWPTVRCCPRGTDTYEISRLVDAAL